MKAKAYKLFLYLAAAVFTVSMTACLGDDDEEEKGGGSKGGSRLSDYLEVGNYSAHYVGEVVVIDFKIRNKSNLSFNDLRLRVYNVTDSNGSYSYGCYISAGEGQEYFHEDIYNLSFSEGETRNMRIMISGSDLQTGISNVSVTLKGASDRIGDLNNNELTFTTNVSDYRQSRNTVWTNDDHMSYTHPTCRRDGDDLYATFRIANNTGVDLRSTRLRVYDVNNGNGNSNFAYYLIVDGNTSLESTEMTINNGEQREVTLYVPKFFQYGARCLNATIRMSSDYYTFADGAFYLTSIDL